MRNKLFLLTFVLMLFPSIHASWAQTIVVPINYGAFDAPAIDKLFVETAILDGRMKMMEQWRQQSTLLAAFPEARTPDVSEATVLFEQGKVAYFNGEFDTAIQKLGSAMDLVEKNILWMASAPAFSDTVFEGGAYLLQIYLYGVNKPEELNTSIDRMIRIFPTREPKGDYFPQELADKYRERMPNQRLGHTLKVETSSDCTTRLNGHAIPIEMAHDGIKIFSGKYAVSKTCGDHIVRTFVVPIYQSETINFEDDFARAYTFPRSKILNATLQSLTMDQLVEFLLLIGKRTEVKHVVGLGIVPEGHPFMREGYTAILVDVDAQKPVRARAAMERELSSPANMKDFIDAVWTGEAYSELTNTLKSRALLHSGIALTTIGGAALIAATTLAVFAKKENDNYTKWSKLYENRENPEKLKSSLQKRNKLSLSADILFGVGGGLAAAGIAMIVVDVLLHKQKGENNLFYASGLNFDLSIQADSMMLGLQYRW